MRNSISNRRSAIEAAVGGSVEEAPQAFAQAVVELVIGKAQLSAIEILPAW